MSTQCPSAPTPTDDAVPHRSAVLEVPGGGDARGRETLARQLAAETDAVLAQLEGTVGRLALAHQAGAPDVETQMTDDDAFAWVQQSIEDIAATLRGLALKRSLEHSSETGRHAVGNRA
ncbi:hypothetical protein [Arthrobacter sp. Ld5]|uniref:hypothetical protein n=1 Tax=Arthrobacter sp. Ld5 TaxID=649152 RepID=UPI003EBC2972